jgi:MoaA/NifB/PqqE/SkfB family radical SAM enzyme
MGAGLRYGSFDCWVSPGGKVTPCGFGQHNAAAADIIKEKGWRRDFCAWERRHPFFYETDYLHDRKYIRYCDYSARGSLSKWVMNDTPLTKRQGERMFEIDCEIKKAKEK